MARASVAAIVVALVVGTGLAAGAADRRAVTATVTVAVSGGGRVHSEPAGAIDCGSRCSVDVEVGATLTLRALPDSGRALQGWEGECTGRAATCLLVVDGRSSVAARFGPPVALATPKALDVTRNAGGRVVGEPAGFIDCGATCTTAWPDGGELTLRAEPEAGFTFAGWERDCTGTGTCRLALTEDRDATAFFRPASLPAPAPTTLTIRVRHEGTDTGAVGVEVGGQTRPQCAGDGAVCEYSVTRGDVVVLTPPEGTLDAWEGGCVGASEVCRLVVTGPTGVTAVFRAGGPIPSFGVNVGRAGRGRVVSDPPGIECGDAKCAAAFGRRTRVRLTATAEPGSRFVGWGGDCGGDAGCSVLADTTRSVTATFRRLRHSLTVAVGGRGRGVVRSAPAGIDCPPDCAEAFVEGEAVGLTPSPAPGSRFLRWEGACTGSACSLTLSGEQAVRAIFERCASLDYRGFAVRALRAPRRVRLAVRLTGGATVRVVLLRGRRVVARMRPRRLGGGNHVLRLRAGRAGRYTVRMTVADACGGAKTQARVVNLR